MAEAINSITIPLSGFFSTNRVWRVSKSQGFVDVVTNRNTGTGNGTLAGWLRPDILGTGTQEWYTRIQVYFNTDHTWPADYDFKMFFALPRTFVDPPSAAYEAGMYFHQDFWCSSGGNFNDVSVIRYSSNFRQFPYQNQYCPPLSPGQDANGINAPRFQKGRWYTLEYHVKLSSGSSGILEMWVDRKKGVSIQWDYLPQRLPRHGLRHDHGLDERCGLADGLLRDRQRNHVPVLHWPAE